MGAPENLKLNENFEGRVLVVANRLPITIKPNPDGHFDYSLSSGGLVSGLKALGKEIDFKWFGWPGIDVHRNDKDTVRKDLQNQYNAFPIFLEEQLAQRHYNGFSNSVLWPLMHQMPEKVGTVESWGYAYHEVNEMFADNILPHVDDDDIIWIHDYHLMLLPGILRERLHKKKGVKIGFFLHTPFPSEDFFMILPFRESICKSLLLCDVVGFHTDQYARNFLSGAGTVLPGVSKSPSDLHWEGRKVVVHDFPVGIEPEDFRQRIKSEPVRKLVEQLEQGFKGQKIIVGVDRLDYTKGIPQKLHAFDRFLTDHPEWVGKVVLIQLAVPTRSDVVTYQKLREEVEQLVGNINGKHGTFSHSPIHYMYRSIDPDMLCALYEIGDACIVSPLNDGLNLVSYEYTACQAEKKGVLVASIYTGAAKVIPSSLEINPWDIPRFADKILQALEMPMDERERRHEENVRVVDARTSLKWGVTFLNTMITSEIPPEEHLLPHK